MPPVNQADVEKYGGIRNPTWLENQPVLSNVLNVLGEVSGVFPSRRIWRDVVKAWQERDKPVQVLPSAGAMLDKTADTLQDVIGLGSPGMDLSDVARMGVVGMGGMLKKMDDNPFQSFTRKPVNDAKLSEALKRVGGGRQKADNFTAPKGFIANEIPEPDYVQRLEDMGVVQLPSGRFITKDQLLKDKAKK